MEKNTMEYVLYIDEKRFHQYKSKAQCEKICEKILDTLAKQLKKPKSAFKILKLAAPKYKIGQKLHSYQNKTVTGKVHTIRPTDDPMWDQHKYILQLVSEDGYTYPSNHINEESLSKTPIK